MEDLHGGRRVLGFREHRVHQDVAGRLQRREHVLAHEQLAGLAGPVLTEGALHAVHDRPMEVQADVGVVLSVFGIAQPLVHDAMTAHEGLAPVDHHQLPMVAVVEHSDVSQPPLVKERHPAARVPHLLHDGLARVLRAFRVQQHAHRHPRSRAVDQRIGHPAPERALLPQERLEVDGSLRRPDAADQDIEERPVLMYLHPVACHRRAERQARERGHQLVDRRVALDVQVRVFVAADRPYDQGQEDHDPEQEATQHFTHTCSPRSWLMVSRSLRPLGQRAYVAALAPDMPVRPGPGLRVPRQPCPATPPPVCYHPATVRPGTIHHAEA